MRMRASDRTTVGGGKWRIRVSLPATAAFGQPQRDPRHRGIGLPAGRPHGVHHTGATLAPSTRATTMELMRWLGHSSPAAALLYQHAGDDRDAEIARALDAMLGAAHAPSNDDRKRDDQQ